MSEISEFESRINAALARIQYSIENFDPSSSKGSAFSMPPTMPGSRAADSGGDTADAGRIAELEALLAAERESYAQMEDRVQALKDRQDGKLNMLQESAEASRAKLAQFEGDLLRLRDVNAELRENNIKLREAILAGIAEPELVNRAMQAELDALRALRAADATEVDAILNELMPLIEEAR